MCLQEGQIRPLIVKRGIEGFDISDGEKTVIDHLVFLVHGIGSVITVILSSDNKTGSSLLPSFKGL